MNEATVNFVGNVGAEPKLSHTTSGKAVLNFRIAVNQRKKQKDEYKDTNTTWYEIVLWEEQAERAIEFITKGVRIFVQGRLIAEPYESKDGVKGVALKVEPTALGLDLMVKSKSDVLNNDNSDPWNQ